MIASDLIIKADFMNLMKRYIKEPTISSKMPSGNTNLNERAQVKAKSLLKY